MACCFRSSFGDCHCYIAAVLFLLGNFLRLYKDVVLMRDLADLEVENKVYYNDLQPLQLASTWTARFATSNLLTASILVTSCAWIFLAIVLIKLAWALSAKGTVAIGSSATIAVLAIAGSLAELLANLFFLGANKAMLSIVETYELNNWITLNGDGFDNTQVRQRRFLDEDEQAEAARVAESAGRGNTTNDVEEDDSPFGGRDDDNYNEQEDLADYDDTFNDVQDVGGDDGPNNFDFEGLRDDPEVDDEFQIDGDFSNSEYDEDGLGWKSLELAYATSKGMVQLVDSVEFLILAAILVTIFWVVRRRRATGLSFSRYWSFLGLLMAFVAFIQSLLALSAYDVWDRRNKAAIYLMAFNQVILLPIWLIWLGLQMKDATESGIDPNVSIATMKEADTTDDPSFSFN
jgi:hypothetical protein